MSHNRPYLSLDADALEVHSQAPNTVGQFLTLCLLGAREEAGFPSNEAGYDEDVNVYLAGLLAHLLEPEFHREAARYIASNDQDLATLVRHNGDERFRYRTYRTNADHLLLAIGLFHHVEASGRNAMRREPQEFVGRGSTYYQLASSSLRRLRRQPSGIEIAMNKLSNDLGRYVEILRRVRTTYFHLTERLGEGSLYHLGRSLPIALNLSAIYDSFLDQFSNFQRDPTLEHFERLESSVRQLRELDPGFAFELPARPAA